MKRFAILFSLIITTLVQAQITSFVPCGTDYFYHQAVVKNPELLKIEEEHNANIREQMQVLAFNKRGKVLYVPVVFHIIHEHGSENISQEQIMNQIEIINEDFRKKAGTNGDSQDPLATDMEIEFRLAQYDPNGNKHDGINRIFSTQTNNATNGVKSISFWDSRKYLNIWVVKSINNSSGSGGTILGYAQFPWQLVTSPNTDGIVIRADQVGKIGIGSRDQAGRTLTHEIGHWLGLYHTFQGGCVGGLSTNCASQGDFVCDTPPVADASFGCNTSRNSCTNDVPNLPDMIRNYMDYSDGDCLNTYTTGQRTRVTAQLANRTQIFGTAPSYNQNIAYAGLNSDGSYLTVPGASVKAPFIYGFENPSPIADGFRINNFNNPTNGWSINTSVAYSGNSCIAMRNFLNPVSLINARDGFQTPEIDLTTVPNPHVEFMFAYAQKNTASNDSLLVRISNTFGMEEVTVFGLQGPQITTAGIQSGEYIPNRDDWRKVSIDLTSFQYFTHARIRFEFVNRRGNNIYIDDLRIGNGSTSTGDDLKSAIQFSASPNPFNDKAEIKFVLKQSEDVNITLTDITGRVIKQIENNTISSGEHSYELVKKDLKSGMYFIRLNAGSGGFTHKILIN